MAQDNKELDAQVRRLMEAGASDDDIVFFIQNYKPEPSTPAQPTVGPSEEKTTSGFLGNVINSGVNLVKDTITGGVSLAKLAARAQRSISDPVEAAKMGQEFVQLVKNSPEIGAQVYAALKGRYGSGQAILDTLYKDPLGVLADVSTLTGVGAVAAGTRAPRLAASLTRAERLTNPLSIVSGTARVPEAIPVVGGRQIPGVTQALDGVGDLAITTTVRPTATVKRMAGQGPKRPATNRDIARHIKDTRATTAEKAERKIQATQRAIDDLVEETDSLDVYPAFDVAPHVRANAGKELEHLVDIGMDEAQLRDVLEARLSRLSGTDRGGTPRRLSLSQALGAKRKAQQLAYDRAQGDSFNAFLDKQIAKGFKEATEEAVGIERPNNPLGTLHQREQSQLITKNALANAEERTSGLSNMLALPTLGTSMLLDSPRFGSAVGINLDRVSDVLKQPLTTQAALAARQEQFIREALLAALAEQQEQD